jgi:hypothetical protein
MAQNDELSIDESEHSTFERSRRLLSWAAITVFGVSFAALLALSATVYWSADNPWIARLDHAWKLSGIAWLVLWTIPHLLRAKRWIVS